MNWHRNMWNDIELNLFEDDGLRLKCGQLWADLSIARVRTKWRKKKYELRDGGNRPHQYARDENYHMIAYFRMISMNVAQSDIHFFVFCCCPDLLLACRFDPYPFHLATSSNIPLNIFFFFSIYFLLFSLSLSLSLFILSNKLNWKKDECRTLEHHCISTAV